MSASKPGQPLNYNVPNTMSDCEVATWGGKRSADGQLVTCFFRAFAGPLQGPEAAAALVMG